jgi:hypothetical protein
MKTQNRISQLTLEYYRRGLATRKERKEVEKALLSDASVRKRYETLQELERETNQLVAEEMRRLNIPETPPVQVIHSFNIVWGFVAAAAVLVCVLVPVFLHLRNSSQNKNNTVAENPVECPAEEILHEPDNMEEIKIVENTPVEDKTLPTPKQSVKKESPNTKPKIAETPRPDPVRSSDKEFKPDSDGSVIASISEPDTGVRMRGGGSEQQSDVSTPPEQEDNSGIPPGLTAIFENMFANKWMVGIVIPDRIRSVAKNAYAGNPVLVVNIGANVDVHDEAIPGNFAKAYNDYGRAKGIYRRLNSNSEEWEKMVNGEWEKLGIRNEE